MKASDFSSELQIIRLLQSALSKGLQNPIKHGEFILRVQFRDGRPIRFNTTLDESFMKINTEGQQHLE